MDPGIDILHHLSKPRDCPCPLPGTFILYQCPFQTTSSSDSTQIHLLYPETLASDLCENVSPLSFVFDPVSVHT